MRAMTISVFDVDMDASFAGVGHEGGCYKLAGGRFAEGVYRYHRPRGFPFGFAAPISRIAASAWALASAL